MKRLCVYFFVCIGVSLPSLSMGQSVDLYTVIKKVLRTSEEAKIARLGLKQVQYDILLADSAFLPQISLAGSWKKRRLADGEATTQKYNALNVAQNLYSGGRDQANLRIAYLKAKKMENTYIKQIHGIIINTTKLYYAIIMNKQLLKMYEKAEQRANFSMKREQIRFTSGIVDKAVYLKARSAFFKFKVQREQIKTKLDNFSAEYRHYVGQMPPAVLPLPPLNLLRVPRTLQAVQAETFKNNLDLQIARLDVSIADKGVAVARAGTLPTVSLQASYGYANAVKQVEGGVSYTIPLFSGGKNVAGVEKALLAQSQAKQLLHKQNSSLQRNILANWKNYTTFKKALSYLKLENQASRMALEAERIRYEQGQADLEKYITAQQNAISSQRDYLQGMLNSANATLTLLSNMGKLDENTFNMAN